MSVRCTVQRGSIFHGVMPASGAAHEALAASFASRTTNFDLLHIRDGFALLSLSLLALSIGKLSDFDLCAIEILGNLFHRGVTRFDEVEVDDDDLETKEDTVDDVVLPFEGSKSRSVRISKASVLISKHLRICILVEEQSQCD